MKAEGRRQKAEVRKATLLAQRAGSSFFLLLSAFCLLPSSVYALCPSTTSDGCGLRIVARYVVRWCVCSSSRSVKLVGSAFSFATRLVGSFLSPNTIASVGHACAHAVVTSPSRTRRFSFSASIFAWLMRCTQYVHFSITPRVRTVTSGLRIGLSAGVS